MTDTYNGAKTTGDRGVPATFIPCRNLHLAENSPPYSVREMCAAAESTSGYNTVIGAQRIGGLWRLYPKTPEARVKLLLQGMTVRGQLVTLFDKNPFIVRSADDGREVYTTKLMIGNVPMSYSNQEIEAIITKLGCKPRSNLMMERDRDESGGLTRWRTGRRFVYIEIPREPLPNQVKIGACTASLYHREQRQNAATVSCSRCLRQGHRAVTCEMDIVCRTCRTPGHKAGDPTCPQPFPPPPSSWASVVAGTPSAAQHAPTSNHRPPPRPSTLGPSASGPSQPVGSGNQTTTRATAATTSSTMTTSAITTATSTPVSSIDPHNTPFIARGRPSIQTTLDFRGTGRSRSCSVSKRQRSSPMSEDSQRKRTVCTDRENATVTSPAGEDSVSDIAGNPADLLGDAAAT